jgi:integrase
MAGYRVRLITVESGLLHPVLTTHDGRPLVLPNLWANDLMQYRRLNTARSYLTDLLVLYQWASNAQIDIHQRISSLTGFRRLEVQRLVRALFTTSRGAPTSGQTGLRRVQAIKSFFGFAFDIYCDSCVDHEIRRNGEKVKDRLLARIAKYGDIHRNHPTGSRIATSLSEVELKVISSAIHPESASNPFRDVNVRVRNYCIFHVAIQTWMRRSELTLLEVSDLDLGASPTIKIKWPSLNNLQKRRDAAGFKTRTREVPISGGLAQALANYIRTSRSSMLKPGAISTALFLSAKDGKRLSVGTINTIFSQIEGIPEVAAFGKRVHPHGLRASGVDEFRRASEHLGAANVVECLEYVGGWKRGSGMPSHYGQVSISEQVRRTFRRKL